MNPADQDLRQKIIDAAKAMLAEGEDVGKLTVRKIALRAGVGVGLINYHFGSKDNLLSMAIGDQMEHILARYAAQANDTATAPDERLKALLKTLCDLAGTDQRLSTSPQVRS